MVGHCENSLMPSRIAASARTLTVSYLGTSWLRIDTTVAEKPHCGKLRLPFMNNTTLLLLIVLSICVRTFSSMECLGLRGWLPSLVADLPRARNDTHMQES